MKIKMLNNFIGVEQKSKSKKKSEGLFHIAEVADALGIVRFISEEYEGPIKLGDEVYYGDKRASVRILNMDIQVMSPENVVAIVENTDVEENKDSKNA